MIGAKIRKAGMFINPILKEISVFKYVPVIKKPIAPNNEIKKPIAAELPMALFIEYQKNFRIGTFIIAPPIPMGADIKPDKKPKITFK